MKLNFAPTSYKQHGHQPIQPFLSEVTRKPELHSHRKLPSVLMHRPFLHRLESAEHSSLSSRQRRHEHRLRRQLYLIHFSKTCEGLRSLLPSATAPNVNIWWSVIQEVVGQDGLISTTVGPLCVTTFHKRSLNSNRNFANQSPRRATSRQRLTLLSDRNRILAGWFNDFPLFYLLVHDQLLTHALIPQSYRTNLYVRCEHYATQRAQQQSTALTGRQKLQAINSL